MSTDRSVTKDLIQTLKDGEDGSSSRAAEKLRRLRSPTTRREDADLTRSSGATFCR